MKPLAECRLYAFVDSAYLHDRPPELVAQQLCDGGADLIQLRAKQSSLVQIRQMAEAILPITRKAGVGVVINDHLSLARELGAEFCHLGQEDFAGTSHTGTKPSAKPVTLDYVRWAAANIQIPWFAIGGINLQNLDEVLSAGARRICVVSAILNSSDIAATCRKFKERLPT